MDQELLNEKSIAYLLDEMPHEERNAQAELFLHKGEMSLLKGDLAKGLERFDLASKLDPNNAKVFFRQGLALFEYGTEEGKEKTLLLANRKFKTAAALNPHFFDTWLVWGNALAFLGKTCSEHHYFIEAGEKYHKALALTAHQPADLLADFYWDYGVVWNHLAIHSKEALDLQLALDAFQKASTLQDHLPSEFWQDFGNTCLELAGRINDVRLYVKAINCFKHALSGATSSFEGWAAMAKALQALYGHTHDEDHFLQAGECFAAAAQLRPQESSLWLDWAAFLCESGRRNQDIKRLRSCIEKCHRAYVCHPEEPMARAIWAEALALIGTISDRLDLIYDAQNKIAEAVMQEESDPDIWYSYGMCLQSFAHYFNDLDYYYQAIEKFQYGLSIDRTCHRLWHGIAGVYAILGGIEAEKDCFEKACRFYNKAIDLQPSSYYIFDYALALSKLGEMTHSQKWLELAVAQFERALSIQKNAIYLHPDWLYHYACTLDMLADFYEDDSYYLRAIEILSHVLMIDPDFPTIHYRLGLAFSHLGELMGEVENFYRATHHFRLAAKHEEDNDQVIVDWGVSLINLSEYVQDTGESSQLQREAEYKITQAAKLGNLQAYYHLSGLYSLLGQHEKSMRFLKKAYDYNSLPPLEEILQDDWLDSLRSTADFREFLSELEKKPNLQEER
jgi:tetratricopeptide (TPR) repeat protein